MKIEINIFDLPENTTEQIIYKISELAKEIRKDYTDPDSECKLIILLCEKLKLFYTT